MLVTIYRIMLSDYAKNFLFVVRDGQNTNLMINMWNGWEYIIYIIN